jgi:hypothetical protein
LEFHLNSLTLAFKKETVTVPFSGISYFWGQMGAGKTSIARLIDYCLGGSIELSPALDQAAQSETSRSTPQSFDLRLEEFLRTRGAHAGLGDEGHPGIDIGRHLFALRGGECRLDPIITHAEGILHH